MFGVSQGQKKIQDHPYVEGSICESCLVHVYGLNVPKQYSFIN